jgi:hypothetical protein
MQRLRFGELAKKLVGASLPRIPRIRRRESGVGASLSVYINRFPREKSEELSNRGVNAHRFARRITEAWHRGSKEYRLVYGSGGTGLRRRTYRRSNVAEVLPESRDWQTRGW